MLNFPNINGFELIKKFGTFNSNNLSGVSRDHMFSVYDGYHNNISPDIISHPTNCQIMQHHNNNKKHKSSSITLEQLQERIKIWDNTH